MPPLTVGIAGITGQLGGLLALKLLDNPNIGSLRGYARDVKKVHPRLAGNPRVQLFVGAALNDRAIKPFVKDCNVVVCAYLGPDDIMIDGQKKLIDACEEAGVPRYVASDWALDFTKLQLGELFLKDPMIHIKAYLETKSKVKGIHILNGAFMDMIFSDFFQMWDDEQGLMRYWGKGDEPWETTSYTNAAEFTAAVIADTSAVGVMKYVGDRKTIHEIADTFEQVYGIKPGLKCLGSLNDLKTLMNKERAENPHDRRKYIPLFMTYFWLSAQTFVGPNTDNERYPDVKAETWEDFMKKRTMMQLKHFSALDFIPN